MKNCFFISVLFIFITCISFAQTGGNNVDPFLGHYTLGGRADFAMFNSHPDSGYEFGYGFFNNDDPEMPIMNSQSNRKIISADGVSGNFLMSTLLDQKRDEVVTGTMESVGDSLYYVKLYIGQFINGVWSVEPYTIDSLKTKPNASNNRNQVRMTSGYFDGGQEKEFIIAYNLPDSSSEITLRMFKLNSTTYQPMEITSNRSEFLPSLGNQAFFDITAGDYDGDGLDEVVLGMNTAGPKIPDFVHENVPFRFHAYDFDITTRQLVSRGTASLIVTVIYPIYTTDGLVYYPLTQFTLSSGDFNGDGRDKCVFGFAVYSHVDGSAYGNFPSYTGYYVETFSLSSDLMNFAFGDNLTQSGQVTTVEGTASYPSVAPMSMVASDLNKNGKDELVVAGMEHLNMYSMDNVTLSLNKLASFSCYSKVGYSGRREIAVTDIDGDTTFADSAHSNWYPEIITSEFTVNPSTSVTSGANNYHRIKVYKVTNPANCAISLANDFVDSGAVSPASMIDGGILSAYLHGNKIMMGKPKLQAVKNLVEPVIILNAPPIHFDMINDSSYDICKSFPIGGSSAFSSQLVQSASNEAQITTDVHNSWGVSSTLSAGFKLFGIGVSASLTAKYGKDFKNTRKTDSTFTAKTSNSAIWDDLIYATVTNYDIWEYPVYADGVKKGNILAAVAHPQAAHWFESNDLSTLLGNNIILDHEPGNLLSYPAYGSPENNPDVGQLIYTKDAYNISPVGSPSSWEINWQNVTSSEADTSNNYGFSAKASVDGWGASFETEGNYDHGAINTHTTTLTKSIDITANLGTINPLFASANYNLQPYVYWSVNGPLVLNYLVDLPTDGIVSFWKAAYSQKPDLCFNCYFRYCTEKGLVYPVELQDWTKEISIFPSTPKLGDTVTVAAIIHNYSLKATSGQVHVRFYIANSENGGIPVLDLNGDSVFTTSSPVAARGDQVVSFKWKVPNGLVSSDSVMYAVVDPDNKIPELKEDNNVGWNRISILNVTAVRPAKSNQISSYMLSQNYPNPFNPVTRINYQIPKFSHVTIKVYNILGQEIATLLNEEKMAGHYSIEFNAINFASGIYFYRMRAGDFVSTKKLILLK